MTPITPQQFVEKWRYVTLNERSACQSHFIDLCRLAGHPEPVEMDPKGSFFRFEKGTAKQAGGEGFADVWYRGHFAWEYKGKHANLDKAYQQLLQYREDLENPPLLVVSDTERIEIHTNFTNSRKRVVTLKPGDLLTGAGYDTLRNIFFNPEAFRVEQTAEDVTREAAARFARLAEILRGQGHEPRAVAHFLIRLLFCLFAEDTGLLPNRVMTQMAVNFRAKAESFTRQLSQLFQTMASGGGFGIEEIQHFDGRLFDDAQALELGREGLEVLIEAAFLDWGNIEPSIFGTLFERSLDPGKRAQLGAHYTSKEDILLIVEPVLMAPLRRRWAEVQARAQELAAERDISSGRKRQGLHEQMGKLMMGFADEVAAVQVLDAACGSGNFLYLALRQLLDLWKEASETMGRLGLDRPSVLVGPSPAQLHGIEINEYAHQLAQAAIWIGYIQWLRENGYGSPGEPVLKPLDSILHMDAILAYDAEGKPYEPEWPKADVIIGNPPFLGDRKMRSELGESYLKDLRNIYSNKISGVIDLVCYWFEKSRFMVETGKTKRVGLIATNSIRYGDSRRVLEKIALDDSIFWAWSDREWTLEGAAVRVSMIGFDNGQESDISLDDKNVEKIYPDLTSGIDLTTAMPLPENKNISYTGTKKYGPFEITDKDAQVMLKDHGNPNQRPNTEVVKPWVNGWDIMHRRRSMWIIDFGVDMPLDKAVMYEKPFEYVIQNVKPQRDKERVIKLREKWWLFEAPRPGMRKAISSLHRFIVTPMTGKYRIFLWLTHPIIPDQQLIVVARDDDYFLGVLHSRVHELWSLKKCNWLGVGNDPRYTATTTFETFPFPWPPGKESQDDPRVQAIAEAARELVRLRDAWLNPPGCGEAELKKRTLTNLYNQRPAWLQNAHARLDRAVFAAYGWEDGLGDEEILERLLALNLERAKGGGAC